MCFLMEEETSDVEMEVTTSTPAPLVSKEAASALRGPEPVLVLYGSESGKTERLARRFHADAAASGVKARFLSLQDVVGAKAKATIAGCAVVIFVSSFGDGAPPRNAKTFYKALLKALESGDRDWASGCKYCVFGCGHSGWRKFCGFPKDLDMSMKAAGCERILPLVQADEKNGFDGYLRDFARVMGVSRDVGRTATSGVSTACDESEGEGDGGEAKGSSSLSGTASASAMANAKWRKSRSAPERPKAVPSASDGSFKYLKVPGIQSIHSGRANPKPLSAPASTPTPRAKTKSAVSATAADAAMMRDVALLMKNKDARAGKARSKSKGMGMEGVGVPPLPKTPLEARKRMSRLKRARSAMAGHAPGQRPHIDLAFGSPIASESLFSLSYLLYISSDGARHSLFALEPAVRSDGRRCGQEGRREEEDREGGESPLGAVHTEKRDEKVPSFRLLCQGQWLARECAERSSRESTGRRRARGR